MFTLAKPSPFGEPDGDRGEGRRSPVCGSQFRAAAPWGAIRSRLSRVAAPAHLNVSGITDFRLGFCSIELKQEIPIRSGMERFGREVDDVATGHGITRNL